MMKRLSMVLLLVGLITLVYVPSAFANGAFFARIPEGLKKDCTLCHSAVPNLNEFGEKFKASNFDFAAVTGGSGNDQQPPGGSGNEKQAPGGAGQSQAKDPNPAEGKSEPQESKVTQIELILPDSINRGEKATLQAKVTVDGKPAEGQKVNFFAETDFFVQGKMNLGTASTNAEGIAEIKYWTRAEAEQVNVAAGVDGEKAQAAGSLSIAAIGPLYHVEEGLDVPFLGTWTIGLAVGLIWATYFFAGYKMLQIRRFAKAEAQEEVGGEEERSQAQA